MHGLNLVPSLQKQSICFLKCPQWKLKDKGHFHKGTRKTDTMLESPFSLFPHTIFPFLNRWKTSFPTPKPAHPVWYRSSWLPEYSQIFDICSWKLVLKRLRSDAVFKYYFIIQNQIWTPYSDLRNLMLLQISMSRIE